MQKQRIVVNSAFGGQVRALRGTRGWMIDYLSNQAEVSRRTISRIENLKPGQTHSFRVETLSRIARALSTTVEELLAGIAGSSQVVHYQLTSWTVL